MAFLKSIILMVFCIGWAKAVQYDFEGEFNRIFHQIRNSFENAWKWMNAAANRSFIRINEVFTARKPAEQGRYKYQDVIPPNDTPSETATVPPLAGTNTQNPTTPEIIAPQLSATATQLSTPINSPQLANVQKPAENTTTSQNDTAKVPQQLTKLPEPENNDGSATKEGVEDQVQSETKQTEPQSDDSPAKESNEDKVHSEKQTEAEIPLKEEPAKSEVELPLVHDVGTGPESEMKVKIIEPIVEDEEESQILATDRPQRIEFETKRVLPSIYNQQNIIILFLFFLIVLMSIYFFLLDRTRSCPTIVIQRDLCGNLKPTMDLYKN